MLPTQYLSNAWFALHLQASADWPELADVSCIVNFEITDVPPTAENTTNKAHYHMIITDGRLQTVAGGKLKNADVNISYNYDAARTEIARGDHPDLAYMQGRMKLDGNYARWLFGLRPLLDSSEYATYLTSLTKHTTF